MSALPKAVKAATLQAIASCLPLKPGRVRLLTMGPSGSNTGALFDKLPQSLKAGMDVRVMSPYRPKGLLPSLRYAIDLGRASVVVSTHGYRKLNPRQANLELWHGFPLKGMNRMDPTELKAGTQRDGFRTADAVASYSALYTTLMGACMGLTAATCRTTGLPRNDLLATENGEILLDRVLGAPTRGRKVVFFMPTFRKALGGRVDGAKSDRNLFGFPDFEAEAFAAYLESRGIRLVAKLHPFEERFFLAEGQARPTHGYELLTDRMLRQQGVELYALLSRADALITDYSSVYFDLLLKDVPCLFTPVDLDSYKTSRGFLMEPYDFGHLGQRYAARPILRRSLTVPCRTGPTMGPSGPGLGILSTFTRISSLPNECGPSFRSWRNEPKAHVGVNHECAVLHLHP